MDLLILHDSTFETIGALDTYESIIWTDRYSSCGDFEVVTEVTEDILALLVEDRHLWSSSSEHLMVIETCQIISDVEDGQRLVVSGRSLESILDRRIVWKRTFLSGNFQTEMQRLLNENVIAPEDNSRRIPNFVFEMSDDPAITNLEIEAQLYGEYIYDVVKAHCEFYSIGFKITLNDNNQLVFKLYSGTDRSYDQITNPHVVFSPKFENLLDANYIKSVKPLKTVSLVVGEEEPTTVAGDGGFSFEPV